MNIYLERQQASSKNPNTDVINNNILNVSNKEEIITNYDMGSQN